MSHNWLNRQTSGFHFSTASKKNFHSVTTGNEDEVTERIYTDFQVLFPLMKLVILLQCAKVWEFHSPLEPAVTDLKII